MQSFYTAKVGLKSQQQRIDEIAANIANVNTAAYKSQSTGFKDTLYTNIINSTNPAVRGTGTLLSSTHRDFTSGTPTETDQDLDLYIDGDGFFAVQDSGGNTLYTRSGSFKVSDQTDGQYLVTTSGDYLLDTNGNKIKLPDSTDVTVSDNGVITSGGTDVATLKMVTFNNKDGLSLTGNGCYAITVSSGGEKASSATVRQGFIESSNVDMTTELTRMMAAQRNFSLDSRAMSVWNDMESVANSLRT